MTSKEIAMPRGALVAVGIAAFCAAAVATSSENAAAPKRHQEFQYQTITLTDARRGPQLKAKPQTSTAGRRYQGFVSRFSAGGTRTEGPRPTLLLRRLSVPHSPN